MEPQTERAESQALQRYRVLDFDDKFGFQNAELCHGRARKAILNILNVSKAPRQGLSNARIRIQVHGRVQKISRKQDDFGIFDNFEEEP